MIVLVGGSMTLDDGSALDSRQAVDGDPASRTTRTALATSLLWWQTVITLASPILDSAGENAFALIIGSRSVMELRPDGTMRRTGLRSLLPGGVATATLTRVRHGGIPEDGFQVLSPPARDDDDQVGVVYGPELRRWRFLDGNEFWLTRAGPALSPAIIIDTGDAAFFGLREFEQRRLFGSDLVLIMPHTAQVSAYIDSYHEWISKGRLAVEMPTPKSWNPDSPPDPIQYARPVPVQADFRVTALAQAGTWHDPSHVEAARSLLAARYDLRLGIWDLVHNPVLRSTLLDAQPVPAAPEQTATLPVGAADRASQQVSQELANRAIQAMVARQLGQLTKAGWQVTGRGIFRLALTRPYSRWEGDESGPLVFLTLSILKRQANVWSWAAYYNHPDGDAARYIAENMELFEGIAAPGKLGVQPGQPVIWRQPGGWADDIDWTQWAAQMAQRTTAWTDAFRDLCSITLEIHNGTRPYPHKY